MAGHASTLAAHRRLDVLEAVRGEVRQTTVLQVAPEEFHRIEIRGVRQQPDDVAAWVSGEPCAHELVLVGAATIPEQDEGPADLPGEMPKEPQDFGAANVAVRVQRQRQADLPAPRHRLRLL